ncbi:unnamed protein product, partial [Ectocarpus sp. 8 AP-2014]
DKDAQTEEVFIYEFDSESVSLYVNGSVNLASEFSNQADLIVDSAVSATGIAAIVGEEGGVRRFISNGVGDFGVATRYAGLSRFTENDGTALAFSPDGSIVYIAMGDQAVRAYTSTGNNSIPRMWSTAAADNELCDIVVSPSGLSVYVLGCASSVVIHLQLDETTGEVLSTAIYTADSSVAGSTSGGVFVIQALELAVMVGRSNSDEIVVFERNATSG